MKRYTSRIVHLIVVALFMPLLSCSGGGGGDSGGGNSGGGTGTSGTRQWTYMVYMGADNTLSGAGLIDLNEMEKVGSSADVAIVIQAEFSPKYTQGITSSSTRRILVANDNDPNNPNLSGGTDIGNVNMATPAALTSFITWAKTTYPAQHYALVVWDHGNGWKARKFSSPARGAVQDETSGSFMSLPDLAKGVGDSSVHFDVINFDACLMAMYEVAYEFKGLTDYMVFSEQTEPGDGDPYDTILAALATTPAMTGRTLATTIVEKYNAYYVPDTRNETTKSAVDMTQITALDTKIISLSAALTSDGTTKAVVQAAQTNTQNYSLPANHDIYDFCSYLNANMVSGTAKTLCGEITTLMATVVINSKYTGAGVAKSHGLAIYLPQAEETSAADITDYGKLKCNLTTRTSASGSWGSYIEGLLGTAVLQTYVPGNFALYLYWTKPDGTVCDADLDLIVVEPDGKSYAPWKGQTTPNGFFSQDSAQSGKSEEYYLTNDMIMKGDYLFLVNYYQNSATCTQAKAHVLVQDPVTASGTWTELSGSPVLLDLSTNPMPIPTPCGTFNCLNTYSDWWFLGGTTRSINAGAGWSLLDLPFNTRDSTFIFRNQRGAALQGLTR